MQAGISILAMERSDLLRVPRDRYEIAIRGHRRQSDGRERPDFAVTTDKAYSRLPQRLVHVAVDNALP